MGLFWGTRMKANMAESEVECFSWVKTTQNSKTEGGIERKKHKNVKLKEENVPEAILPGEKLEECTVCYRSSTSNWRSQANVHILAGYLLPLVFSKMPDQGIPEVICSQRHTTTCTSHHNSRWLLDLSPQTIPSTLARLVWFPGYHSFPK